MRLVWRPVAAGSAITRFGSEGAEHAPLARALGESVLGLIRIDPNGRVGRHPAKICQLAYIVAGSGMVSGDDHAKLEVEAGDAVLWSPGEQHETTSDHGMILLIIEAEAVEFVSSTGD